MAASILYRIFLIEKNYEKCLGGNIGCNEKTLPDVLKIRDKVGVTNDLLFLFIFTVVHLRAT